MSRPEKLVVITGTGTGIGKTWVATELLQYLRGRGFRVAARKPVQSIDPEERVTDADVLAGASGEGPNAVCLPNRTYRVPLAPPMAAEALESPVFTIADLAAEMSWPDGLDIGLVEGAGGCCSPLAADGDTCDLIAALSPDRVVLVTHAGLGSIHDVRSATRALGARLGDSPGNPSLAVHLNRFLPGDSLHQANEEWLKERYGYATFHDPPALAEMLAIG